MQDKTEPTTISKQEAYNLAEAYVPQSILNSAMMSNATNYNITDYEYIGINQNSTFDNIEHYDFKFYGTWSELDHYGKLADNGKFYVTIEVPIDGSYFYSMAYPDFN